MTSFSDTDDDTNIKNLLEAADISLFELYESKNINPNVNKVVISQASSSLKSQRYLDGVHLDVEPDLDLSYGMRNFAYKKMTEFIEKDVDFVTLKQPENIGRKDNFKKLKLFHESPEVTLCKKQPDCPIHVKKRIKIKKRNVDNEIILKKSDKLKEAVIKSADIINGIETRYWAPRKQRKVVHYIGTNKDYRCNIEKQKIFNLDKNNIIFIT